jgi:hypothetical protein
MPKGLAIARAGASQFKERSNNARVIAAFCTFLIGANIPKRCCHVFAENKSIDQKQVIGTQSLP